MLKLDVEKMNVPKKYFQDKVALILSGLSILVVTFTIILVFVRANFSEGGSYIVGYRANLGIDAFYSGSTANIISFIVFSLVVLTLQVILCWRVYEIDRRLAIGVLATGLLLLIMSFIVSNALIALH